MKKEDISKLKDILGKVEVIIGYEKAGYRTRPCFIKSPDELGRLVTGTCMSANLVHYLNRVRGKAGIFVKRCDIPSVISLIQEGRFTRKDVVLIGTVCPGSLDLEKVKEQSSGINTERIISIDVENEEVNVSDGKNCSKLNLRDTIEDKCLSCSMPVPDKEAVDLLVGDPSEAREISSKKNPIEEKTAEIEALSHDERWKFWKKEFERCIRCYACKDACPVCYCKRCMVDINNPRWVSPANVWQDNVVYHLMRTNHVAGRCTNCGECTRVCPVGIPLNLLTNKLFKIIVDNFNHVPGEKEDQKPPLTCFSSDDPEKFIY